MSYPPQPALLGSITWSHSHESHWGTTKTAISRPLQKMSASFLWNLCLSLRSSGMTEFAATSAYIQRLWVLYLCPPVCFLTLKLFFHISVCFCFFYKYEHFVKNIFSLYDNILLTFWTLLSTSPSGSRLCWQPSVRRMLTSPCWSYPPPKGRKPKRKWWLWRGRKTGSCTS